MLVFCLEVERPVMEVGSRETTPFSAVWDDIPLFNWSMDVIWVNLGPLEFIPFPFHAAAAKLFPCDPLVRTSTIATTTDAIHSKPPTPATILTYVSSVTVPSLPPPLAPSLEDAIC